MLFSCELEEDFLQRSLERAELADADARAREAAVDLHTVLGFGLEADGAVLAVEIIAVRIINLINNGQFKNVTEQFVNQNATALTQSFTSPAFGVISPPTISAEHAVLVLAAWGIGLTIVAAGLLWLRDVT